ncbi:hypothetical protein ED92_38345 [Amycolatopsis sp. MJM2582]|nr:hypothetical protein ED92_38345 [Amycolatopsis sp. MJM2582]
MRILRRSDVEAASPASVGRLTVAKGVKTSDYADVVPGGPACQLQAVSRTRHPQMTKKRAHSDEKPLIRRGSFQL